MTRKTVTVYCSHVPDLEQHYHDTARDFGYALADANLGLIYGGADRGLMGNVADAILEKGGHVTGVVPNVKRLMEVTHTRLTELVQVEEMWERKRVMYQRTDAFVVLPGGFGTLDEVFEVLTLRKLGVLDKNVYFLNHRGFYTHLEEMLDKFIDARMIEPECKKFYFFIDTVPELMAKLAQDPKIAAN